MSNEETSAYRDLFPFVDSKEPDCTQNGLVFLVALADGGQEGVVTALVFVRIVSYISATTVVFLLGESESIWVRSTALNFT